MLRTLLVVPFVALAFALGGCATTSIQVNERTVNADHFKNPADFQQKVDYVNQNRWMSQKDVFALFKIDVRSKNLERLLPDEIWHTLNGNSAIMLATDDAGTPLKLKDLEGWKYPYVRVQRRGKLTKPFDIEYTDTGNEQGVVFIFANGRLHQAYPYGVADVDKHEKKLIVDPFQAIGDGISGAIRH